MKTSPRSYRPIQLAALTAFVLIAISAVAPKPVTAQAEEHPVLPDLAPREVEIRGELQIRFPLLERQPLVGFNPPPQIPVLPAGRRPLVADYKQARADLPQGTIERPDAPTAVASATGLVNGELEAGAGSYFDRLASARFGGAASDAVSFRVSFDYSGSDGSEVVAGSTVRNPFDSMDGAAHIEYSGDQIRTGASFSGFADYYPLYVAGALLPTPVDGFPDGPDRSGRGATVGAWVGSGLASNTTFGLSADWSASEFETKLQNVTAPDERRIDVSGSISTPVGYARALVSAEAGTGGRDTGGFVGSTHQYVDGSVGFSVSDIAGFSGRLSLGVLGTRYDSRFSVNGSKRKLLYLTPDVYASLQLTPSVAAFVENDPGIEKNALREIFRFSPFVDANPDAGPTLNVVNAKTGLRMTFGRLSFIPYAGYEWSPNQLYYSSGVAGQSSATSPVTRSAKAETIVGGASLSFGLTGSLTAAISGEYRDHRLTGLDAAIPYQPMIVTEGTITYHFLEDRMLLRLRGRYEGARTVDETEIGELDPLTSIDALAAFDLTPNIGFTLRGINLTDSDLETWDRYRRTGRQFLGGIRIRW